MFYKLGIYFPGSSSNSCHDLKKYFQLAFHFKLTVGRLTLVYSCTFLHILFFGSAPRTNIQYNIEIQNLEKSI